MLSDTQIENLAKRMDIPLAGVFFKDELPKKLQLNRGYIINMSNAFDEEGKENEGTHFVALQLRTYPNKTIGLYFDPFGVPQPKEVSDAVIRTIGHDIPNTTKDIQSLMNGACGYYCLAWLHFTMASHYRAKELFHDTTIFLDLFDDLNSSVDFKKNEWILKNFFRNADHGRRKSVEIDGIGLDTIEHDDEKGTPDLMRIPVDVKYV
jgi:hypothetical protein